MTHQTNAHAPRARHSWWLSLLAVFKLAQGVLLCVVAIEVVELIDQDLDAFLEQAVVRLHADPHNPIIAAALGRAHGVSPATLDQYAGISGAFGLLSLAQGIGLWLRRFWAEYLVAVSTGLLMPLEVHELVEQPHLASAAILVANAAAVAFMIHRIRLRHRRASDRAYT